MSMLLSDPTVVSLVLDIQSDWFNHYSDLPKPMDNGFSIQKRKRLAL